MDNKTPPGASARNEGSDRQQGGQKDRSSTIGDAHAARDRHPAAPASIASDRGGLQDKPTDLADSATSAVRETYKAVAAQASELAANVGDELAHAAGDQKRRGAEIMLGFAKAISSAADEIQQQSPSVARQFKSAAKGVGRLSDDVKDKTVQELIDVASGYARQRPAAFFAGAVVAGFAFSRFLKSGAHHSASETFPPVPTSVGRNGRA